MDGDTIMLIIYNTKTGHKNNMGTNSAFPHGNIPGVILSEHEIPIRIHDNSNLVSKIKSAREWEPIFDENMKLIDVDIKKTHAQYQSENPPEPIETLDDKLNKILQSIASIDTRLKKAEEKLK